MPTAVLSLSSEIKGVKELSDLVDKLEKENQDMKTPLELCGVAAIRATAKNFKDEGIREIGFVWKKLSKWTLNSRKKRKGRKKARFKDKILRDTGIMAQSVGSKTKTGGIFVLKRDSLRVGTKIDYAADHQYGKVNPERRIPNVKVRRHKVKNHRRVSKSGKVSIIKTHTVKTHTRTQFVPRTKTPARPFMAVTPSLADSCLRQFNNWLDDMGL